MLEIGNLTLTRLNTQDSYWLDREITEEELEFALKTSSNEKAPGPDGMIFGLVKVLWNRLKYPLLETIKEFSSSCRLPRGFNSSFITLIPKVDQPKLVNEFRPISLINSTSKLLQKYWQIGWSNERSNNWNKLLRAKYSCTVNTGLENSFEGKNVPEMLRNIISTNNSEAFNGSLISSNFRWSVRNGAKVLFWEDRWMKDNSKNLSLKFRRLHNISKIKFLHVKDVCLKWSDPNTQISDLWTINLRSWELDEVCNLNEIVASITLTQGKDILVWTQTGRPFTCKDGKVKLLNHTEEPARM
ncbi:hypothetical protein POM88_023202 [Heracleum sosnowskyi]|uniref:Uncharacterized protein n=1 Tax=Heracleum sosnowskyi TaxID=360622 RepID=A0AAD8IJD8_9APIA|nr:hypothetical protein POM88_023202 [Heracleum sosnowskyi]